MNVPGASHSHLPSILLRLGLWQTNLGLARRGVQGRIDHPRNSPPALLANRPPWPHASPPRVPRVRRQTSCPESFSRCPGDASLLDSFVPGVDDCSRLVKAAEVQWSVPTVVH